MNDNELTMKIKFEGDTSGIDRSIDETIEKFDDAGRRFGETIDSFKKDTGDAGENYLSQMERLQSEHSSYLRDLGILRTEGKERYEHNTGRNADDVAIRGQQILNQMKVMTDNIRPLVETLKDSSSVFKQNAADIKDITSTIKSTVQTEAKNKTIGHTKVSTRNGDFFMPVDDINASVDTLMHNRNITTTQRRYNIPEAQMRQIVKASILADYPLAQTERVTNMNAAMREMYTRPKNVIEATQGTMLADSVAASVAAGRPTYVAPTWATQHQSTRFLNQAGIEKVQEMISGKIVNGQRVGGFSSEGLQIIKEIAATPIGKKIFSFTPHGNLKMDGQVEIGQLISAFSQGGFNAWTKIAPGLHNKIDLYDMSDDNQKKVVSKIQSGTPNDVLEYNKKIYELQQALMAEDSDYTQHDRPHDNTSATHGVILTNLPKVKTRRFDVNKIIFDKKGEQKTIQTMHGESGLIRAINSARAANGLDEYDDYTNFEPIRIVDGAMVKDEKNEEQNARARKIQGAREDESYFPIGFHSFKTETPEIRREENEMLDKLWGRRMMYLRGYDREQYKKMYPNRTKYSYVLNSMVDETGRVPVEEYTREQLDERIKNGWTTEDEWIQTEDGTYQPADIVNKMAKFNDYTNKQLTPSMVINPSVKISKAQYDALSDKEKEDYIESDIYKDSEYVMKKIPKIIIVDEKQLDIDGGGFMSNMGEQYQEGAQVRGMGSLKGQLKNENYFRIAKNMGAKYVRDIYGNEYSTDEFANQETLVLTNGMLKGYDPHEFMTYDEATKAWTQTEEDRARHDEYLATLYRNDPLAAVASFQHDNDTNPNKKIGTQASDFIQMNMARAELQAKRHAEILKAVETEEGFREYIGKNNPSLPSINGTYNMSDPTIIAAKDKWIRDKRDEFEQGEIESIKGEVIETSRVGISASAAILKEALSRNEKKLAEGSAEDEEYREIVNRAKNYFKNNKSESDLNAWGLLDDKGEINEQALVDLLTLTKDNNGGLVVADMDNPLSAVSTLQRSPSGFGQRVMARNASGMLRGYWEDVAGVHNLSGIKVNDEVRQMLAGADEDGDTVKVISSWLTNGNLLNLLTAGNHAEEEKLKIAESLKNGTIKEDYGERIKEAIENNQSMKEEEKADLLFAYEQLTDIGLEKIIADSNRSDEELRARSDKEIKSMEDTEADIFHKEAIPTKSKHYGDYQNLLEQREANKHAIIGMGYGSNAGVAGAGIRLKGNALFNARNLGYELELLNATYDAATTINKKPGKLDTKAYGTSKLPRKLTKIKSLIKEATAVEEKNGRYYFKDNSDGNAESREIDANDVLKTKDGTLYYLGALRGQYDKLKDSGVDVGGYNGYASPLSMIGGYSHSGADRMALRERIEMIENYPTLDSEFEAQKELIKNVVTPTGKTNSRNTNDRIFKFAKQMLLSGNKQSITNYVVKALSENDSGDEEKITSEQKRLKEISNRIKIAAEELTDDEWKQIINDEEESFNNDEYSSTYIKYRHGEKSKYSEEEYIKKRREELQNLVDNYKDFQVAPEFESMAKKEFDDNSTESNLLSRIQIMPQIVDLYSTIAAGFTSGSRIGIDKDEVEIIDQNILKFEEEVKDLVGGLSDDEMYYIYAKSDIKDMTEQRKDLIKRLINKGALTNTMRGWVGGLSLTNSQNTPVGLGMTTVEQMEDLLDDNASIETIDKSKRAHDIQIHDARNDVSKYRINGVSIEDMLHKQFGDETTGYGSLQTREASFTEGLNFSNRQLIDHSDYGRDFFAQLSYLANKSSLFTNEDEKAGIEDFKNKIRSKYGTTIGEDDVSLIARVFGYKDKSIHATQDDLNRLTTLGINNQSVFDWSKADDETKDYYSYAMKYLADSGLYFKNKQQQNDEIEKKKQETIDKYAELGGDIKDFTNPGGPGSPGGPDNPDNPNNDELKKLLEYFRQLSLEQARNKQEQQGIYEGIAGDITARINSNDSASKAAEGLWSLAGKMQLHEKDNPENYSRFAQYFNDIDKRVSSGKRKLITMKELGQDITDADMYNNLAAAINATEQNRGGYQKAYVESIYDRSKQTFEELQYKPSKFTSWQKGRAAYLGNLTETKNTATDILYETILNQQGIYDSELKQQIEQEKKDKDYTKLYDRLKGLTNRYNKDFVDERLELANMAESEVINGAVDRAKARLDDYDANWVTNLDLQQQNLRLKARKKSEATSITGILDGNKQLIAEAENIKLSAKSALDDMKDEDKARLYEDSSIDTASLEKIMKAADDEIKYLTGDFMNERIDSYLHGIDKKLTSFKKSRTDSKHFTEDKRDDIFYKLQNYIRELDEALNSTDLSEEKKKKLLEEKTKILAEITEQEKADSLESTNTDDLALLALQNKYNYEAQKHQRLGYQTLVDIGSQSWQESVRGLKFRKGELEEAIMKQEQNRDKHKAGSEEYNKAQKYIDEYNKELDEVEKDIDDASKIESSKPRMALEGLKATFIKKIPSAITNFAVSYSKKASEFIKQLESQMKEIQAITLKSDDEMVSIRKNAIQQAVDLKTSVSNVTSVQAALYRQGLSDTEVAQNTEAVIKYSAVTGDDVSGALKDLTTAVQSGLVDNIEDAMDVLVALGDTVATTADQIAAGMQKSAATAKNYGVTYEELTTMLAIGTSKTQLGGSQIGRSMNSIMSRYGKVTKEGMANVDSETVAINDVEAALRNVGVSIREDSNTFRDFTDVMVDLSEVWEGLTDVQRSNISYAMAGTTQANVFQNLMEGMAEGVNGKSFAELLEEAENAEGTTEEKYDIKTDTIEAAIERFNSALDATSENLFGLTNIIKSIINAGTDIVNFFNSNEISGGIFSGGLIASAIITLLTGNVLAGAAVAVGSVVVSGIAALIGNIIESTTDKYKAEQTNKTAQEEYEAEAEYNDMLSTKITNITETLDKYSDEEYKTKTLKETVSAEEFSEIEQEFKTLSYSFGEFTSSIDLTTATVEEFNEVMSEINKANAELSAESIVRAMGKVDTKAATMEDYYRGLVDIRFISIKDKIDTTGINFSGIGSPSNPIEIIEWILDNNGFNENRTHQNFVNALDGYFSTEDIENMWAQYYAIGGGENTESIEANYDIAKSNISNKLALYSDYFDALGISGMEDTFTNMLLAELGSDVFKLDDEALSKTVENFINRHVINPIKNGETSAAEIAEKYSQHKYTYGDGKYHATEEAAAEAPQEEAEASARTNVNTVLEPIKETQNQIAQNETAISEAEEKLSNLQARKADILTQIGNIETVDTEALDAELTSVDEQIEALAGAPDYWENINNSLRTAKEAYDFIKVKREKIQKTALQMSDFETNTGLDFSTAGETIAENIETYGSAMIDAESDLFDNYNFIANYIANNFADYELSDFQNKDGSWNQDAIDNALSELLSPGRYLYGNKRDVLTSYQSQIASNKKLVEENKPQYEYWKQVSDSYNEINSSWQSILEELPEGWQWLAEHVKDEFQSGKSLDEIKNEMQTWYNNAEKQIEINNGRIEDAETRLADLQSRRAEIIAKLADANTSAANKGALERELAGVEQNISATETTISELEADNDALDSTTTILGDAMHTTEKAGSMGWYAGSDVSQETKDEASALMSDVIEQFSSESEITLEYINTVLAKMAELKEKGIVFEDEIVEAIESYKDVLNGGKYASSKGRLYDITTGKYLTQSAQSYVQTSLNYGELENKKTFVADLKRFSGIEDSREALSTFWDYINSNADLITQYSSYLGTEEFGAAVDAIEMGTGSYLDLIEAMMDMAETVQESTLYASDFINGIVETNEKVSAAQQFLNSDKTAADIYRYEEMMGYQHGYLDVDTLTSTAEYTVNSGSNDIETSLAEQANDLVNDVYATAKAAGIDVEHKWTDKTTWDEMLSDLRAAGVDTSSYEGKYGILTSAGLTSITGVSKRQNNDLYYVKDANGNIQYDANGNPIMRSYSYGTDLYTKAEDEEPIYYTQAAATNSYGQVTYSGVGDNKDKNYVAIEWDENGNPTKWIQTNSTDSSYLGADGLNPTRNFEDDTYAIEGYEGKYIAITNDDDEIIGYYNAESGVITDANSVVMDTEEVTVGNKNGSGVVTDITWGLLNNEDNVKNLISSYGVSDTSDIASAQMLGMFKEGKTYDEIVGEISKDGNLQELLESSSELQEILKEYSEGTIDAAEATGRWNKALGRTAQQTASVKKSLTSLDKEMKNIQYLRNKGWGSLTSDEKDEVASYNGYDSAEDAANYGKSGDELMAGLDLEYDSLEEQYFDELKSIGNDTIDIGTLTPTIKANVEANTELGTFTMDENSTYEDFLAMGFDEMWARIYAEACAQGYTLTFTTTDNRDADGNGTVEYGLSSVTSSNGSGSSGVKKTSSGGGGGSSTDTTKQKWDRKLTLAKHRLTLVQTQAEQAQSEGRLTDYGNLLGQEKTEYKSYISTLKSAIAAESAHMNKLSKNSDEWYAARDTVNL